MLFKIFTLHTSSYVDEQNASYCLQLCNNYLQINITELLHNVKILQNSNYNTNMKKIIDVHKIMSIVFIILKFRDDFFILKGRRFYTI